LTSLPEICLRSAVIYVTLLVAFRILGKREISQFTPFDLILIMVLANAVQNAMVGENTSLVGGLTAAGVLMGLNYVLGRALRSNRSLRRLVEGTPTLLMRHGRVEWQNLNREDVDIDTLHAAAREHGVLKLEEVDLAVLEIDGTISIVTRPSSVETARKRKRKANPRLRA
jgi:uncharacterized membrane protein YcaP (DUF421 family)